MPTLAQLLDQADALSRIIDLRIAQQLGEAPPSGQMTQAAMAQALGMSLTDYRRLEAITLAKAAARIGNPADLLASLPTEKNNIHTISK